MVFSQQLWNISNTLDLGFQLHSVYAHMALRFHDLAMGECSLSYLCVVPVALVSYLMTSPFELSLPMGKHSLDFLLSNSNSIERI